MFAKRLQFYFSGWKCKKKIHFSSKQSISYELQSLNYLTQLFDLEIEVKESLGGTTRGEQFKSQRFHCEEL